MEDSKIEWTHHTFNPWWGCVKVSPGCHGCYAEAMARRVGKQVWGAAASRWFFADKHWAEPVKWNREAEAASERHRVFCASMADVFEERDDLVPHRDRLWALIRATPSLDWLLLTKRPENIALMLPSDWGRGYDNVWLGTTVESRAYYGRVAALAAVPARVRFLSVEPMLEAMPDLPLGGIDWVIVGGESGPRHRQMSVDWARQVRDRCLSARVSFFFKQWGGAQPKSGGRDLDGRMWDEFPTPKHRLSEMAEKVIWALRMHPELLVEVRDALALEP
jgi:protein gp37